MFVVDEAELSTITHMVMADINHYVCENICVEKKKGGGLYPPLKINSLFDLKDILLGIRRFYLLQ